MLINIIITDRAQEILWSYFTGLTLILVQQLIGLTPHSMV